jgi:hypothetical protein
MLAFMRLLSCRSFPISLPLLFFCLVLAYSDRSNAGQAPAQAISQPPVKVNFVDLAEKAGIVAQNVYGGVDSKKFIIETTGSGVAVIDYDNDGWPDLFFVNGTTLDDKNKDLSNRLYHNNHDGTFTDVTKKANLWHAGWGQAACVGDYDNDGHDDLFVSYYGKNVLYHNNGDGTFTDVSEKAGVAGKGSTWGTGCAFVDYDRDGKLDLIVANYVDFDLSTAPAPGAGPTCMWKGAPVMCGPRGLAWTKNILYHNRGDGTFEDVTVKARIDKTNGHYGLGVSTLDYDDDGWPDIFVACDSTPSILYHNNHDGTFTDVAVTIGAAFNEDGREQAGMGSTIADYDGDGRLDIFKTNFSDDTPTLLHNEGASGFTDATTPAGLGLETKYLGWGTMFFDFDNDGWPDLIVGNGHVYPEVDKFNLGSNYEEPRLLYHNNGNGTFTNISATSGEAITKPHSSRGVAVADLWNDGRMSVIISNMNERPLLLVNQEKYANHWIAFKTVGTKSNRDGIGARIRVNAGKRLFVDEVRSGSSYNSSSDLRLHFGLGAATAVDSVEVRWPNGDVEKFSAKVDQFNTLKEGDGQKVQPGKH